MRQRLPASLGSLEADVALLPENWVSSEPVDLEILLDLFERLYSELAVEALYPGAHYTTMDGVLKSVGIAIVRGRSYVACEKVYPSRAVGERDYISPGSIYKPVEVKGFRIGCIVCIDIFYPELSRVQALLGSRLIVNPAKIPSEKLEVWRSILATRAAENIIYVAGSNPAYGSYKDGRSVSGGSTVYNPDGTERISLGRLEGVAVVPLDTGLIETYRRRYAYWEDLMSSTQSHYRSLVSKALDPRPL